VVKVHPVRNHAVPAASALAYTKEVEAALVRSGRALLAGAYVSGEARAELEDQHVHASDATMKSSRPLSTDFVLSGWVSTERRDAGAVRYVVTLQLIDVRTNEKVWMGRRVA
jgi:hypothetical protein